MEIFSRAVETKSLDKKFSVIAEALKQNSYLVVECRKDKESDPDAILLSPSLYKMLIDFFEAYQLLTNTPDFTELRVENRKLKRQVSTLLTELKGKMGVEERLSEGCWKEISESIYEALESKTKIWE